MWSLAEPVILHSMVADRSERSRRSMRKEARTFAISRSPGLATPIIDADSFSRSRCRLAGSSPSVYLYQALAFFGVEHPEELPGIMIPEIVSRLVRVRHWIDIALLSWRGPAPWEVD